MRSVKDIYKKVRDYSIISTIISFLGLVVWLVMALYNNYINIGGDVGNLITDIPTRVWFYVIIIFLGLSIVTAFVMHLLLEAGGSLITADEFRRNRELQKEREILKADALQAKIDSTDKVKRHNTIGPAVKEFFGNTGEFFVGIKDKVVDFSKESLDKFRNKNAEMSEKREEKKREKAEAKAAREAELARIREEERIEEEKRQADEAVRLEEERKIEEQRQKEEAERKAKEDALRLEQEEEERKRQEKLDRQKALAEKKAKEADQARLEEELAEQARLAQERKEQELLEKEEAERKAKEEAAKQAEEEAKRKEEEQKTATRIAAEKLVDTAKEEAEKKPAKPKKPKVVTKTKADFIELIFDQTGVSKNKANKFLKFFAETIKEALVNRDDVDLEEFGMFTTIEMPAKEAVNPQTKEKIVVPAHHQVRFRVSDDFKDKFH